ncbi:tyrosine-type recombinase/integrase [Bradyrhizobium sp. DASA03076]|uniref:tyrosine-type recombinase/integrase n=1 Tax=Bradyrhizobium sp. BLXBL-03 TaxID=3395916 RepID=UPI003F6EC952
MLYRVVRPMKRDGSRFQLYVRRIPVDVRERLVGRTLHFPLGDVTLPVTIKASSQAVRFSLRSDDPAEVKVRVAAADQYLDRVLRAFREDSPTSLTNAQATAMAGRLYRAWARGEGRERTQAVEQGPDGKMHPVPHDPGDDAAIFEATLSRLARLETIGKHEMDKPRAERHGLSLDHLPPPDQSPDPAALEIRLGLLVDRLLLSEGIRRVDDASRGLLLRAFWLALRDALEARLRNAQGDYTPDAKSERFPAWVSPNTKQPGPAKGGSLTSLVEGWWVEAKARNLKPSTHESYSNSMSAFVVFLGHDDCSRVTKNDVIAFKDHRLAAINPRTGKPISAKTVKDSDLSGLKAVFGWAVSNGRMHDNPAEGVTLKASKPRKLRSKAFTEAEAKAILAASLNVKRGGELPETFAAKRWVPWLMAYSGARVGEMAQLRKEDLKRNGDIWFLTVTPEAGTVKTNEARDVALHPHLVEMGFVKFVQLAPAGHLFLRRSKDGDVLGPLQGIKNRLAEFAREVVPDEGVAPNHGWRHRFKPVGVREGIDRRTLDVISGHALEGRTVADGYHGVELEDQAAALAKYPRYEVT